MALSTHLTQISDFHLKNCKKNIITETNVGDIFTDSLSYLEKFYKKNNVKIDRIIKKVVLKSEKYKIIALEKNIFLMITKKRSGNFRLQIGYPFEILSKIINKKVSGYEIRLCLCSEILRKEQREVLESILNTKIENVKLIEFRKEVLKNLKNVRNAYSINLFNYIGDTIISRYYSNKLKEQFNLNIVSSFSRFKNHISQDFINIKDLDINIMKQTIKDNSLIIMPDIIDAHFISSVDIIGTLNKKLTYFLPGRNLLVNINPNNKNRIVHLKREDPLLSSGNIEAHMNDCLEPFMPCNINLFGKNNLKLDKHNLNILIAPFASTKVKEMSLNFVKNLVINLDSKKVNNIFISCGKKGSKNYKLVEKLLTQIELRYSLCKILEDKSISELSKKIEVNNINLVFACDSAIASLVTHKKIINFTIYFAESWDNESKRSMAGESPIGFCGYSPYQLPVVISKKESNRLDNVLTLIDKIGCETNLPKKGNLENIYKNYIKLSKEFKLEEFLEYYNPLELLKNVKNLDNRTIEDSIKISPLYKLKCS